jgi:glycosyltransferase involved in cell wall biosynthesis
MIPVTALILTCNEEANIGRTLRALSWIGEVVIIDSGSNDRTLEAARASHPNVRVLSRAFDTHATQWNFGLDQVATPWVLTLDADYEVSEALAAEIRSLAPAEQVSGYEARFQYRIFGRALRSSVYPPRIILFRRDRGTYFDDGHTQRLRIDGPVESLSAVVFHDDRKTFGQWLLSQKRYARLEARHLLIAEPAQLSVPDRLRAKIFFAAPAMFFYLLFGRGLILDGWPGWSYVGQRTIAELLLSANLLFNRRELNRRTDDRGEQPAVGGR